MLKHCSNTKITRRTALKLGASMITSLSLGSIPLRMFGAKEAQAADKNGSSHKQLGFSHNQDRCIGCRSCESACKDLNKWEAGVQWRKVYPQDKNGHTIYLSMSCNHCADPACQKVCPVGAYTKRAKDGIVIHDASKCVGCGYCLNACPYHAPHMGEKSGAVSKCHFCYQRIDKGQKPACVETCPMAALNFGDLEELKKQPGAVMQIPGLPFPDITKPSFVIIPPK